MPFQEEFISDSLNINKAIPRKLNLLKLVVFLWCATSLLSDVTLFMQNNSIIAWGQKSSEMI